jgi:hypothetical protein
MGEMQKKPLRQQVDIPETAERFFMISFCIGKDLSLA